MRPALLILVTALGLLAVAGCKASVSASADVNSKKGDDLDRPPPPPSTDLAAQGPRTSFIGVSHALTLSPEAATTPSCRCMAAVVGAPTDKSFVWRGTPPTVGEDALVLGISNEGTPCDLAAQGRGPSIQGIEQEGNNVVVTIEESRDGVPQARGAVFTRPQGDSFLIFRSSRRRLPYDDALPNSGSQVCRVRIGTAASSAPASSNGQAASPSRRAGAPVETYLPRLGEGLGYASAGGGAWGRGAVGPALGGAGTA